MSYPNGRWRGTRPSMSSAASGGFGHALPGRGTWHMPARPPMRLPPLGPYARVGLALGLLVGTFWYPAGTPVPGDKVPGGGGVPPQAWAWSPGWVTACGPAAADPTYGNQYQWDFRPGQCPLPPDLCGITGQAQAAFLPPINNSRCAKLWLGPTPLLLPVLRYQLITQRTRPVAGAGLLPLYIGGVIPFPGTAVPVGQPITRPGMASVGVLPRPVRWGPYAPLPAWPEQSDSGWKVPAAGYPPIGIPVSPPLPPEVVGQDRPVVRPYPPWVDVKSPPNDREAKVADASGRMATLFKALSFWGSSNAIIDALWRSLPAHARSPHARTGQKYADVFRAFGTGEINAAAFGHALSYWLGYKTAGALFGTAFRAAEGIGQGGYQLYRAWATGEYVGSSAGVLFRGTAAERASPPSSRTTIGYRGVRTLDRRYARDLSRIEREFRRGFNGETRDRKAYATQRRARSIRELNQRHQRSLTRHGHED